MQRSLQRLKVGMGRGAAKRNAFKFRLAKGRTDLHQRKCAKVCLALSPRLAAGLQRYFFFASAWLLLPPVLPQGNAGAAGLGGCFGFLVSRLPRTWPLAIEIPFIV